ncbi:MAG: fumarylacetoacetate hydrolase family protein [Proteobacteria bacterium]|nr:fumarylacetoacetate hydrolase family protein [Pseudomonadota bacterium]
MDDSQTHDAARLLHAAWRDQKPIPGLPDACRPQNLDDGYRIQAALAAVHDVPVAGYKIGATNKVAQRLFDVDAPFFGRIFAPSVLVSPAEIAAGSVRLHIIEAEFDFTLKKDLPARDGAYSRDEVMAAVDNLHPAIEIPDSRYENWREAGMPQLVADNAIAALLILGPPAADWRELDLSRHAVTVKVNGEAVDVGSGANVLGDPRNVLLWLANELSARGLGLKAGQVVTTGSAANVITVKPGDTVVADFGDLGVAQATFG